MKKLCMLIMIYFISFIIGAGITYAMNENKGDVVEEKDHYQKFLTLYLENQEKVVKQIKGLKDKIVDYISLEQTKEDVLNSSRVKDLVDVLTGQREAFFTEEAVVLYGAIPFDFNHLPEKADEKIYLIPGKVIKVDGKYVYVISQNEHIFQIRQIYNSYLDSLEYLEKNDYINVIGRFMNYSDDMPSFRVIWIKVDVDFSPDETID